MDPELKTLQKLFLVFGFRRKKLVGHKV